MFVTRSFKLGGRTAHIQHGEESVQPGDGCLGHGYINLFSLAGFVALHQSQDDLDESLVPSLEVYQRRPALQRWAIGVPGKIHVSA
ncbi:hypothetical protein ES703_121871 [subsurface metagenome]